MKPDVFSDALQFSNDLPSFDSWMISLNSSKYVDNVLTSPEA